jgi:DNA-3-methyladenine glycosylase II
LETALRGRSNSHPLVDLPDPERLLSSRDSTLARVIRSHSSPWPNRPTEDPIWGLMRIVMAQQISTQVACRIAERVKSFHPLLTTPESRIAPEITSLRVLGLSERRAQCCVTILTNSDEIRRKVELGQTWAQALAGIKGIGHWTVSVFRIMVLRDPDVLPLGDVGLERAIAKVYGRKRNVERLGEKWRPFRSVACWYLWRTLGNEQLG